MRIWIVAALVACGAGGQTSDDGGSVSDDTVGGGGADDTTVTGDTAPPDDGPDPDNVRACIAESWVQRTCTGCHFAGNHLDLRDDALEVLKTTNRELFQDAPILVPGDPDASLLVRKLDAKVGRVTLGPDEGDPMPVDRPIDPEDADLIRDWVASGAPLPEGC